MTMKQVNKEFVETYYGCWEKFKEARKKDYCKVQYEWSCYIDELVKDGILTPRQWHNAYLPETGRIY